MKFRKKPVIIEAVLWTGKNHKKIFNFLGGQKYGGLIPGGDNFYINYDKIRGGLVIKTLEGERSASIGDWIIKGVHGEYYPCKPDIFDMTYEKVEDGEEGI